jgi:hypothetical protein
MPQPLPNELQRENYKELHATIKTVILATWKAEMGRIIVPSPSRFAPPSQQEKLGSHTLPSSQLLWERPNRKIQVGPSTKQDPVSK